MGLISFLKGVGEKIFKKEETAAATPEVRTASCQCPFGSRQIIGSTL